MTKSIKNLFILVLVMGLMLTLTGCGFASKAQKIVDQFKAGEELTVEMITDKMGDPTIDFTAEALGLKSGAIVWVSGCKTYDDVKAKWEAEETVEALVVTLLANKVVTVTFVDNYTEKDAK